MNDHELFVVDGILYDRQRVPQHQRFLPMITLKDDELENRFTPARMGPPRGTEGPPPGTVAR